MHEITIVAHDGTETLLIAEMASSDAIIAALQQIKRRAKTARIWPPAIIRIDVKYIPVPIA